MSGWDTTATSAAQVPNEPDVRDTALASESIPSSKPSGRWLNLRKRLPHVCFHQSSDCAICRWLSEYPKSQ